jgi:hypothetical protein
MAQRAPSHEQLFSKPVARPAWMTFCLSFLPQAITHDLEVQQSPKESDATDDGRMPDAQNRRRVRSVNKVWTRSDGFTLSGARRV